MFCSKCGAENSEDASKCAQCGEQLVEVQKRHPAAVRSLVFGLLSFCIPLLASIAAIICGIIALRAVKSQPGRAKGNPMAIAGIILGSLGLLLNLLQAAIALPGFWQAQTRSYVARSQAEMRMLHNGLETYYIDNNTLPTDLKQLTTPRAYIYVGGEEPVYDLPTDPFTDGEVYDYAYAMEPPKRWVLRSVGPDGEPTADLHAVLEEGEGSDGHLYQQWSFDPTNGVKSTGDVMRWSSR